MCDEHFMEALEHSAHLNAGQWNGCDERWWDEENQLVRRFKGGRQKDLCVKS